MANIKPGEPAKNKYNPIKYSFVPIEAGEQHVLTSDPWSYLVTNLQLILPTKKGKNRANTERAFHYARLAEEFYRAADTTPLPAKGTLVYYGMLNLVKCYLSAKGVELEKTYEHHGLNLPLGKKGVIQAKKQPDPKDEPGDSSYINIFAKFSELLGKPIAGEVSFDLKSALSHIPEIHGVYCSTTGEKRKLLPANISFLVNDSKTNIFTEVSFKKEQEYKVDCSKFLKGLRASYFQDGFEQPGMIVYRSKAKKTFTKENLSTKYRNILADYQDFDVVSILTRQGYRYYFDLKPGDFPALSYSLAAMFYLGSAARYRPVEMESVLHGELRPLVTELISLAPRQFLYHMVSHITGKECVIPFAAL